MGARPVARPTKPVINLAKKM